RLLLVGVAVGEARDVVLVDDVHRGLLRRGSAAVDPHVSDEDVVLAPLLRTGVAREPPRAVQLAGTLLGSLPDLGLLLGEATVEGLAGALLPVRLAVVVGAVPLGRGVSLVEGVVHPAVVEGLLRLELVGVALGERPGAGRVRWGDLAAHVPTLARAC